MDCPRMAEMKANIAHLSRERILLWDERKKLLAERERLEALCTKLKRSLDGSSWVIASIHDRATETIAGLDKENAHLHRALAYKDELYARERKDHQAQLKAAMEKLQQKDELIERMQAEFAELESLNEQLSGEVDDLWHRVDDQTYWIADCEKVMERQAATLAARPPPAPWAPCGVTAKPWSVHQNNKIAQLVADNEVLRQQLTSLQQENDELQKERQQLKETLYDSEALEFEVSTVSKRVAHLEVEKLQRELDHEKILATNHQLQGLVADLTTQLQEHTQVSQVVADNQELRQQLTSLQQENDALQKESQQLQDTLYELEVAEFDVHTMKKRVTYLEVEKLQRESEHDEVTATNHQLQGLVADQQIQLQELQSKPSNMDHHHQAAAACDLVVAAQAALKPVAVFKCRSSANDNQAEEPGTPDLSDLSCSYPSSNQSSRRNSEVSEVCLAHNTDSCSSRDSAASDSIRSDAMEKINSLHPLYRYGSWV